MSIEEAAGPPVEIWPDNVESVNVFNSMMTQWRVGLNGYTGLDYNVLPVVMRVNGVSSDRQDEVFADNCIMEEAALQTIRKAKK